MERVYLETSFVSYLAARPSRELVMAANQHVTRDWWEFRREKYELYLSQRVIDEIVAGDERAALDRLQYVKALPLVDLNREVFELANELVTHGPFPQKAEADAIHVAAATIHGLDYLLTWNCRHIANVEIAKVAAKISRMKGYEFPVICTPAELMGD
jgi:predicted nucleic acid-binding protein